jgi:HEAT repeat protein
MSTNLIQNKSLFYRMLSVLAFSLLCGMVVKAQGTTQPSQEEINRRVHQIFDNDLKESVFTTNQGIRATRMRADASMEELNQIKKFGDKAVAPLTEYLSSPDYRAQHLAVNLLGAIGSKSVIKPLTYAAERSGSSAVRLAAVANLGQQSWNDVAAILKRVSTSDSDPFVRKKADEIIKNRQKSKAE